VAIVGGGSTWNPIAGKGQAGASCPIYPSHRRPLKSIRMSPPTSRPDLTDLREMLVVAVLTLVGGVLRLWSLGRLGLVHFDEGVYALAGLWVFSPHGFLGLDPTTIAYAPPGFPFLVGLAYAFLGVSDLSAILVSMVTGTLTIPTVGWVAHRTFGRGAGAVSAAFAALSGPHLAVSRMALTDASFLFLWMLAIGQGQRFLERPNPARAVLLGVSVGMAQLFKYNGWISGILVARGGAWWMLFPRAERSSKEVLATWGWGLVAAAVAAVVYWPWYRFVESHGGYAALLTHHRGYISGITSWPGHLSVQLAQEVALSGGGMWLICGGLAAASGALASLGDFALDRRLLPRVLVEVLSFSALGLMSHLGWWAALVWTAGILLRGRRASQATYLLAVGWAALSALTPFYHPYARLWLPLQAFGWLFLGGAFLVIRSLVEVAGRGTSWRWRGASDPLLWFALICLVGAGLQALSPDSPWKRRSPGLLGPSDSLRRACRTLASDLPRNQASLRTYARPPVMFYFAGRIPVFPQPDLQRLLSVRDSGSWALLDEAMVRQGSDPRVARAALHGDWVIVREAHTTLNLPTLLDIDPSAATAGRWDTDAPLLLMRSK